jgi:2-oxoglutarate dehydrogenase E2 component (dihydrolipoamide succinyltransferase)
MPNNILVPDLGESVIEATVARWLKQPGEKVGSGEAVVVLETDKVDLEVAAPSDGILSAVNKQAGDDVKVGDVLGAVDVVGAQPNLPTEKAPAQHAPAPEPAPANAAVPSSSDDRIVTPVAKRMAEAQHVDLAQVQASDGGKVTKEDVERYLQSQSAPVAAIPAPAAPTPVPTPAPAAKPAAPAPAPSAPPAPVAVSDGRREERVKLSRRRRTIAQRLVEAQHTAAMLTTFNEIDMTAVMDLRARRKESYARRNGVSLGLSSFFVKASIGALKAFPQVNAELQGDELIIKHYYDIGIAIGASEGLVVPVLRDADRLSFAQIEKSIKDYAAQSENGTLSLESLRGGTFTITNGGVYGSLMSTPIINPPQVAILGLHKIQPRPMALDGQVVIRSMMYVALSYDHRVVDGREAVQFLVRVKELVEDPEQLLIEG